MLAICIAFLSSDPLTRGSVEVQRVKLKLIGKEGKE